ncbi:Hypothetical predicted protein [Prunus dulcis]|uniref:Uncharacterized protein n=1 Tax=Prunus dulcis TaxID=3755 RepID=A0A5E4GA46_PRUDU|nr:Hypothetical predicted protein [Prunus dulcis]
MFEIELKVVAQWFVRHLSKVLRFNWVCSPIRIQAVATPSGQWHDQFREWGLVDVRASWPRHLMTSNHSAVLTAVYFQVHQFEADRQAPAVIPMVFVPNYFGKHCLHPDDQQLFSGARHGRLFLGSAVGWCLASSEDHPADQ